MDVTDLHQIHWPDPEGDVEETDAASPGSCDTFQFDSDVATVYLSDIRERKERKWLCRRGNFRSVARGRIAWLSTTLSVYPRNRDDVQTTDSIVWRLLFLWEVETLSWH
jgi:hypothetical protein